MLELIHISLLCTSKSYGALRHELGFCPHCVDPHVSCARSVASAQDSKAEPYYPGTSVMCSAVLNTPHFRTRALLWDSIFFFFYGTRSNQCCSSSTALYWLFLLPIYLSAIQDLYLRRIADYMSVHAAVHVFSSASSKN